MEILISDSPVAEPFFRADDIEFPDWIDRDTFVEMDHEREEEIVWVSSIRDLVYSGCASGCYMPAVTYYNARETMGEFGDDVLDFIYDQFGELPELPKSCRRWSEICVHWLSMAVELWATCAHLEIEREGY